MKFALLGLFLALGAAQGCESKSTAAVTAAACEHGVKPELCTRCNPKLEPVFRAKGDWCEEHARAESQCVLCNPELAQQGIK